VSWGGVRVKATDSTTGGEPICTIYHDGCRVWPPSPPPPADPCTITISSTADEPARWNSGPRIDECGLNRHERRRSTKLARTRR